MVDFIKTNIRRNLLLAALACGVFLLTTVVAAETTGKPAKPTSTAQDLVREGIAAFEQGNLLMQKSPQDADAAYETAIGKFQAAIDAGANNGKLYYNIGNAELRRGNIGKAIANYRRAERLIPGDGRLDANLQYALSLRRNQIASSGSTQLLDTLLFAHYHTPLKTRIIIGLTIYAIFWLVLLIRLRVRNARLGWVAIGLAVIWLAIGASVYGEWQIESRIPRGVVVQNDVTVRKGDGQSYTPKFAEPLHEGDEFVILEDRGKWINIELPDGKTGWISSDNAEKI